MMRLLNYWPQALMFSLHQRLAVWSCRTCLTQRRLLPYSKSGLGRWFAAGQRRWGETRGTNN